MLNLKKSKWGKVREFVFTRPLPTTSAWSRVDMHVLYPDLYKADTGSRSALRKEIADQAQNQITENRQIYIASQSVGFYSMHFLATGRSVCLGCGNGRINIHDLQSTKRSHTVQVSRQCEPVTCIRDYRGGAAHRLMAGTADGSLKGYTFNEAEEGLEETFSMSLESAIYSMDTSENYHVCAMDSRRIQILDAERAEYIRDVGLISTDLRGEVSEVGHQQRVTCVRFHPTSKYLCVSVGWDKTAFLWDIRMEPAKAAVRTIKGPKVCGDGLDIRDNNCLTASFAKQDALQIWDLGSGELINSIKYRDGDEQAEYLYSGRFVDSDRVVAGGSGTNDAKIINIKTGELEGVILDSKPIHSVGYSNGVVAAGGVSCYVHLGNFKPH